MTKKPRTILVIEDERSLLGIVKLKLEKNGWQVITSRSVERAFATPLEETPAGELSRTSVEQALAHIEKLEQVDAIWLDHDLLGPENGLDFVTKFKDNGGRWSTIPIFVVSNTSDPALVKAYAKLGVSHYYVKAEHKLETIMAEINSTLDRLK